MTCSPLLRPLPSLGGISMWGQLCIPLAAFRPSPACLPGRLTHGSPESLPFVHMDIFSKNSPSSSSKYSLSGIFLALYCTNVRHIKPRRSLRQSCVSTTVKSNPSAHQGDPSITSTTWSFHRISAAGLLSVNTDPVSDRTK